MSTTSHVKQPIKQLHSFLHHCCFRDGYDDVDDDDDDDGDDDDFAYCLHTGTRSVMMASAAYKLYALKASTSHSY